MNFISSAMVTKGWLLKQVYPYLRGQQIQSNQVAVVSQFLDYQTKEVRDLLTWEAKKYTQILNSEVDPLPCRIISTLHPDIDMVQSVKGKEVLFYACPACHGRLFRACGTCIFCHAYPTEVIEPSSGTLGIYTNLIEYLYPHSTTPAISTVVAAINKIGEKKKKEKISKSELKAVLKNIKNYLP